MNRRQRIQNILSQALEPTLLEITDESNKHRVPQGLETHIKVLLVSQKFLGLTLIKRHRLVNELVAEEFEKGLHALSLNLLTQSEWDAREQKRTPTPPCRGGEK